jgi:23S rRNA G2445 N2-methylase RlmL
MPYRSSSVDVIISDIPFGLQDKTTSVNELYPLMLREMYRIVKEGSRVVLLTSQVDVLVDVVNDMNRYASLLSLRFPFILCCN